MKISRKVSALIFAPLLAACAGGSIDTGDEQALSMDGSPTEISRHFDAASIVGEVNIVECTLSGGAITHCLSVTLQPKPASFEIGPWCPRNISDGPDVSGIWLKDGMVYDADGAFIQNLPRFYGDDSWQLFDPETGAVNVTDSVVSCRAAARPDVDPQYQNHCVECHVEYLSEGTYQTYVIPIEPVPAAHVESRVGHDGVGIAFSGVRLDAAAPLEAILSAHTLAPFDDCGGHVNPEVGYHIHAVTDCLKGVSLNDGHADQIGIALDGYAIHAQFDADGTEPDDLDECRGHSTRNNGYHYHVGAAGSNEIIGCHTGQTGCVLSSATDSCDASQYVRRGPPPGER